MHYKGKPAKSRNVTALSSLDACSTGKITVSGWEVTDMLANLGRKGDGRPIVSADSTHSFPNGKLRCKHDLHTQTFPDREIPLAQTPLMTNNFPNGKLDKP